MSFPGSDNSLTIPGFQVFPSLWPPCQQFVTVPSKNYAQLEMWANAQRDGRPAECRWRPLFNAAKFG